jgi:hypothetical protein
MKTKLENAQAGNSALFTPLQVCGASENQNVFSRFSPAATGECYDWNTQKLNYCSDAVAMLAGTPTGSYPGHSLEDWND